MKKEILNNLIKIISPFCIEINEINQIKVKSCLGDNPEEIHLNITVSNINNEILKNIITAFDESCYIILNIIREKTRNSHNLMLTIISNDAFEHQL